MDSRTLFFLTTLALVCIALLFGVNYAPSLQKPFFGEGIAKKSVEKAFIVNGDKKAPLNDTTLNILLNSINTSQALSKESLPKNLTPVSFEKIEIDFKDSAPYILKPLGFKEDTLYFILLDPEIKQPKILEDTSKGKLKKALSAYSL